MTLPVDPRGPPPPLPSAGPGRMFLLCDPAKADAVMTRPERWSDLLFRLGLIERPLAEGEGEAVALRLGDTALDMVSGGAARSLLDTAMSDPGMPASIAGPPPNLAGVGSAVIALDVRGATRHRATAAQRSCALAALLAPFIGARLLYWQPARLWSAADDLAQAVRAMEASGLPPVLHLVAFAASPEEPAGDHGLTTRGLDWFAGFDMRVHAPAAMPEAEVVRRAARLAIDSLLNGDPAGPVDLPGLVPGETVRIAPLQWQDGGWWLPVTISGWHRS